ncbi:sterol uptake control 2 [Fusarium circinatum]|uniref:Sterol uptake control 2 n=1 Tax=Fusarium circinatum TaxID=48490 RepID=A0A8H5TVN6_FUSCI|nr:sterol uptake control 2 [Fusarium circinatum]
MQAVLSLTAAHMAYLNPERRLRYIANAAHYHNEGLKGFREAIAQSDDSIAEALFVWSSLNLLYVFGVSGRLGESLCDNLDWGTRGDRILGIGFIPMILGIVTVLESYEYFQTSSSTSLKNILSVGNLEEIQPPDEATDAEDEQFCKLRSIWENSNDAPIYEKALQALRQCRFFMEQFSDKATKHTGDLDRSWQGAFAFVGLAPKEYFPLLHQRQPLA